ncbi:MAG: hypothetical protein NC213_08170 [Acetobacter sp.]|nr:hypothetical protein [Bacteroides sp.]MCM1341705.1 hypothetical protein [Acetobacter sp.]MCM1432356.1 hypothetical protein [Clostridiales bacterium]
MNKRIISFIQSILALVIAAASIGFPFCAYALDENCLTSRTYFSNCENMITYDDNGLSGVTRYYLDEREGCFYFYISFHDNAINDGVDDRIYFKFHISNEIESVSFEVDENGMDSSSAENLKSKINVISDFYSTSCRNKGGKVVIAFELKDKDYKKLLNSIRCDYYCGNKRSYKLLDDIYLDMRLETTTKTAKTTAEKSFAEKTETKNKTEKKENSKSTKKFDESTKFVPSQRRNTTAKSSTSHSTKFDAEKYAHSYTENDSSFANDEEYWNQVISDNVLSNKHQSLADTEVSDSNNLLIYSAVAMMSIGVIVTFYGLSRVNKNRSDGYFDESDEKKE